MRNKLVSAWVLVPVCLFVAGCASTMPGQKYMARYHRASKLYQEKRYEETLKELRPLLIHFPVWVDGSLLYAMAARATKTIEGRRLASQILARLVSNYPDRADVRRELASLYFEQSFFGYAKTQYETLLRADNSDSQSHYMLGLIVRRDWKKYREEKDLTRIIAEFARTVETDTLNKAAFSGLAIAYLEKERPDSTQLVLDRLLRNFPDCEDALMLSAIAHHERGEYGRSMEEWKKFFSVCDSTTRSVFDDIGLLTTPQQKTKLKHLNKKAREEFVRRFWKELDPTPTTELNERVLEHWRRVGISKFLFSVDATGTPGWRTGPGEALIRYGFPKTREYTFTLDGTNGLSLPMLIWRYVDREGSFEVAFVDYSLTGEFQYFEFSQLPTVFDQKVYYSPTSYEHDYGARVFHNLFAGAGFLRGSGVREEFYVGIPVERVAKGDWRKVPFEAVVFDSLWNEVFRVSTTLESARTYAETGADTLLIREVDVDLPPGRYVVALAAADSVSGTLGLTKEKITVPSLLRDSLSVSDIELAFLLPEKRVDAGVGGDDGILPNPSGAYVVPRPLRLYYEVYNLARDRDGKYRFVTEYSILPSSKKGGTFWEFLASLFASGQHYIVSSFERQVESSSSAERLSIDISALRDGSYNLILDVEDSVTKQHVTVQRGFDKVSSSSTPGGASAAGHL